MKNQRFLIYPLLLTGMFILLASSCKKDDNNNGGNKADIPELTTSEATEIKMTAAISGGNITSDGGAPVTARGVFWSTSQNPTDNDNKTSDGTGAESFTSNLAGLTANTTYYVRAYAINQAGTGYGTVKSFTTPDDYSGQVGTVTDIDGNIYKTIGIGSQIWMAENLKTVRYRNSEPIEFPGENSSEWEINTSGAYSWYNNDIDNKHTYGALYNWYAVNNSNGLCPVGWHVPSEGEWTSLISYLVESNPEITLGKVGNALKSCRQVLSPLSDSCATTAHPRWNAHVTHFGTDDFGFSALPGGYRYYNGAYSSLGFNGYWWSSTPQSDKKSWSRDMGLNYSSLYHYEGNNQRGYSVRCIKD